jgi:hypothetical protein
MVHPRGIRLRWLKRPEKACGYSGKANFSLRGDIAFPPLEKPIEGTCFSVERMVYPSYDCRVRPSYEWHREAARPPPSPSVAGPVGSLGDQTSIQENDALLLVGC